MYIQREGWYGGHLVCGLVDHWLTRNLYIYICMYVQICIYISIYVYIFMYINIYTYTHTREHVLSTPVL